MLLPLAILLGLAQACAPAVAPETLLSVVQAESGRDPLAVGVNGRNRRSYRPATPAAAAALAGRLIAGGQNLDLGLAQINSRNLARLGLTVADAFDPCRNLAAEAQVLAAGYRRASPIPGAEQAALRSALSAYNTGDPVRGLRNGYVARVTRAAAQVVPALRPAGAEPGPAEAQPNPPPPAPPTLDVFTARGADRVRVF